MLVCIIILSFLAVIEWMLIWLLCKKYRRKVIKEGLLVDIIKEGHSYDEE